MRGEKDEFELSGHLSRLRRIARSYLSDPLCQGAERSDPPDQPDDAVRKSAAKAQLLRGGQ